MRRVFGIGETVLDLIFRDNQPIASKAGGSALNTMVSLARLDVPAFFVSEIGNDKVGNLIMRFLEENDLKTKYVCRFDEGKSALALAFLNQNNDAEYEFFKDYPSQRLEGDMPDFSKNDIVVFGSFFGINPVVRPRLLEYLHFARDKGAIIIYDPNFRSHHLKNRQNLIKTIEENFLLADIVRGSDEDFQNIYGLKHAEDVFKQVVPFCDNLIITANKNGVYTFSKNFTHHFQVPIIDPISTIGAGDNFNAGMIKALLDFNIVKNASLQLSKSDWMHLAAYGIEFSGEVCMQMENYVPISFKYHLHNKVKKRLRIMN